MQFLANRHPDLPSVPTIVELGRNPQEQQLFRLFANDPEWVPPLRLTVSDRISPRYPAQHHQQTQLWMAYRRGRPVGRVTSAVPGLALAGFVES